MVGMKKASRGSSPAGVFRYVLKGGHMIGGNLAGSTRQEMSAEFAVASQLRPDIKKMVWHQSLRLPKGETLPESEWVRLADKYMLKMGFSHDAHQRAYFIHDDPKGQHIHIVANRVGLDGNVYLGRNENLLSSKLCRVFEKEFGLIQVKEDPTKIKRAAIGHGEKGRSDRLDEIPLTIRLQHAIDAASKDKPSFSVFVARLEAKGIDVLPNGKTGQCSGMSFAVDGEARSGTDLGHSYKFAQLTKRIDFDKLRDQPVIDKLRKKAAADREEVKGDLLPVVTTDTAPKPYSGPKRTLDLAFKAQDDGVYAWKKSGTPALVDRGTHISVMSRSESAIRASLQLAKQKGWASVVAHGNAEFQRKSWLIAQEMGLELQGYTPSEQDKEELKRRLELKMEKYNGQDFRDAQDVGRSREPGRDGSRLGGVDQRTGDHADRADDGIGVTDGIGENRAVSNSPVIETDRDGNIRSRRNHEDNARQATKGKARSSNSRGTTKAHADRNGRVRAGVRRITAVRDDMAVIINERSHREQRRSVVESTKRAESAVRVKQRAVAQKIVAERARRIESAQNGIGLYQSRACKLIKAHEQNKAVDWSAIDRKVAKDLLVELHAADEVKALLRSESPAFADSGANHDKAIDSIIADLLADNDVLRAREAQKALEAEEATKKAIKNAQDQDRSMRM
ncbi:MAG: relaxase/mobilization nuclease domain-containing protein [Halobacteriota archaeon]